MENKTTELLKELAQMENNFSDRLERRQLKSELKGRLDALKEEVEFLKKLQIEIEGLENAYTDGFGQNEFNIDVSKRLASIQEEIKLIEEKI